MCVYVPVCLYNASDFRCLFGSILFHLAPVCFSLSVSLCAHTMCVCVRACLHILLWIFRSIFNEYLSRCHIISLDKNQTNTQHPSLPMLYMILFQPLFAFITITHTEMEVVRKTVVSLKWTYAPRATAKDGDSAMWDSIRKIVLPPQLSLSLSLGLAVSVSLATP